MTTMYHMWYHILKMCSISLVFISLFLFAMSSSFVDAATARFALAAPGLKNTQLVQNDASNIYNLSTPDITPYANYSAGSYMLELYSSTGVVIGTHKNIYDFR